MKASQPAIAAAPISDCVSVSMADKRSSWSVVPRRPVSRQVELARPLEATSSRPAYKITTGLVAQFVTLASAAADWPDLAENCRPRAQLYGVHAYSARKASSTLTARREPHRLSRLRPSVARSSLEIEVLISVQTFPPFLGQQSVGQCADGGPTAVRVRPWSRV